MSLQSYSGSKGWCNVGFWPFQRKNQDVSQAKLTGISEKIGSAFTKIRSDLSDINSGLKSNEKQVEQLNRWVEYLFSHQQALVAQQQSVVMQSKEVSKKHVELDRNHRKVHSSNEQALHKLARVEERVLDAHKTIASNYQLTRKEIDTIKAWLSRFSTHVENQRASHDNLHNEVKQLQEEIREVLDQYQTSLESLEGQNREFQRRMETLESSLNRIQQSGTTESTKLFLPKSETLSQQTMPGYFEKHLLARAKPNRRSYITSLILETIASHKYSTKEIEDMIVKEKQLCGRTTFYAYVKELRDKGRIDTASINDRQILVTVQNNP